MKRLASASLVTCIVLAVDGRPASATGAVQIAHQLRLPDRAFLPAIVEPHYDRLAPNALADLYPFSLNHSTTYEKLGRIMGYYERATLEHILFFRYQASIFPDAAAATHALRDGVRYTMTHGGVRHTSCTTALGTLCVTVALSARFGYTYVYNAFAYDWCLAEISAEAPGRSSAGKRGGIPSGEATLLMTAVRVVKATCRGEPPTTSAASRTQSRQTICYKGEMPFVELTEMRIVRKV
jgi:hypothetical protein